jgi:hypothetical protein
MLHGLSAPKISHTARTPAIRHRARRNRNTGDKLRHRAGAACRCVTRRAGTCRTRENLSESNDMAHKRRRCQRNRLQVRRQVIGTGRGISRRENWADMIARGLRLSYPRSRYCQFSGSFGRVLAVNDKIRNSDASDARSLVKRFNALRRVQSATDATLTRIRIA